jgi:zinc D-Ala-D-Ala carboxypeptidase
MKLGHHFTLSEMCKTSTGHANFPATEQQTVNLTRLVALILDPLRADSGAIRVTSGFRSQKVNEAVGGVDGSYHRHGLAADIQSDQFSPYELAERIEFLALPIDKVIVEFGGWVHVQIKPAGETNRTEYLVAEKVGSETHYSEMT